MEFRLLAALIFPIFLLGSRADCATFEDLSAQATAARTSNRVPEAIQLYRQALEVNRGWQEGWLYLGTLLYDSDQFKEGRDALSHFVELRPDVPPAWGLLGLCEFRTGEYGTALKHIQKSLVESAKDQPQMEAVLKYHEAQLLARTGEPDKAIQKYVWFVSNAPPQPELLTAIGIAALRAPLVPAEIPADQKELYLAAGKAAFYAISRDYTNAGQAFSELLTRFPKAPGVHYIHAIFLMGNSPAESIAEFRQEIANNPSNGAAHAMVAWAMLNQREGAAALPDAREAARLSPSFPTAQYAYGRALVETGDLPKGIEHLQAALKLDPANIEVHFALVTAFSKAGRTREAQMERRLTIEMSKGAVPVVQQ